MPKNEVRHRQLYQGMPVDLSTVVLVERQGGETRGYTKSTAVLRVMRRLSVPWNMLYGFTIVPPFIRDFCYDGDRICFAKLPLTSLFIFCLAWSNAVAKVRYRVFGKNETCGLPDKATRQRLTRWIEE
eukprot:scaffold155619_cov28-Prasinocladus_malaysianus.AAC.1